MNIPSDSKFKESVFSNYMLYNTLKNNGHDIKKYGYWSNNPYFKNFEELNEYVATSISRPYNLTNR